MSTTNNSQINNSQVSSKNTRVIITCFVAALSGLLFGLDVGYINGSLQFIQKEFSLATSQAETVTAALLFGAALGALVSGFFSYKLGRKYTLILAALLFCLASFACIASHSYKMLVGARAMLGVAVGMASFIAPLYLSEISPKKMRGGLIAMYQLMITIGILGMFISNYFLAPYGSWRLMMVTIIVPAIVMFIGCLFLPQSPRWLVFKGKIERARTTLFKLRPAAYVEQELTEIKTSLQLHVTKSKSLWKNQWLWRVVLLGVLLQVLQQASGANALLYYSSRIFHQAGFGNDNVNTIMIGVMKVVTTFITIAFIDKLGRKPVLYFGLILITFSLLTVGYLFNQQVLTGFLSDLQKQLVLIASLTLIFGFAIALGPVIWIICSEIYPLEYRDTCITLSTTANWLANMMIGRYTLSMFDVFGYGNTFFFFAVCCIAGMVLIYYFTPETKNVSLEKIEANLKQLKPLRLLGKD